MLGGLIFVTTAAADLIWTVSRGSRAIGDSESAYFAAQAAVERALLEFEKGSGSLTGLQAPTAIPLPGNPLATYTTSANEDIYAPAYTSDLDAEDDETQPITASNRLLVNVAPGKSFFLNLSTSGAGYPSNVQVNLRTNLTAAMTLTVFAQNTQATTTLISRGNQSTVNIPPAASNDAKIAIKNPAGNPTATVRFSPTGGNLPLGIIITGTGRYRGAERKIEVAKPNWVFY